MQKEFLFVQTNWQFKWKKRVCGHTCLGIPMSLWSHQICRSSWPTPSSCRWPKGSDASCTSSCQSTAKKCSAKSIGPEPFCIPFWSGRRVQLCSMVTLSSPNKHMALMGSLLQKHDSLKYLVVPGILRSARLSPWAWERALEIGERIEGLPEWRGLRTTGWCRDRSFGAASQRCDARKDQSSKGCPAKDINSEYL